METRRHKFPRFRLVAIAAATAVVIPAFAQTTRTWDGGGGNWSNAANWSDDAAPVSGDSITFDLATGGTTTNDVLAGNVFINALTFGTNAGAYILNGSSPLRFTSITSSSAADQVINFGVIFSNTRSVNVSGSGTLTLNGAVSNFQPGQQAGIRKSGAGTLVLNGINTYTQATEVQAGILRLGAANAIATSAMVTLSGGTLDTGGFDQTFGSLSVTSDSFLDFAGAGEITFASASLAGTLTLLNFDAGANLLSFTGGLLSGDASSIVLAGYTTTINGDGTVVFTAIPEPAACALLGGLAVLALAALRRRNA